MTIDFKEIDSIVDDIDVDEIVSDTEIDSILASAGVGETKQEEKPLKPIFTPKSKEGEVFQQAIAEGVNAVGFGLPEHITKKFGYEIPEPTTPIAQIGAGVGSLAGFIGGPVKAGKAIGTRLTAPLVAKISASMAVAKGNRLIKFGSKAIDPNVMKNVGMTLGQSGINLGIASGLMTPEDGLFSPVQRAKQFGSGAVTGVVFGGMSYLPGRPSRMIANSALVGGRSTLAGESIEEQIFNYGLGAYFGIHGTDIRASMANQIKLGRLVSGGLKNKADVNTALGEVEESVDSFVRRTNLKEGKPISDKDFIENLSWSNQPTVYNRDGRFGLYGQNTPEYKNVRASHVKNFTDTLIKMLNVNENTLRTDKVGRILDLMTGPAEGARGKKTFGTKKISSSKINKLTDKQLDALTKELINASEPPNPRTFAPNRPKGPLNLWDMIFRPQIWVMNKLGLGKAYEQLDGKTLTDSRIKDNNEILSSSHRHINVLNNLKRVNGINGYENIKRHLRGEISERALGGASGGKAVRSAKLIRRYLDTQITDINKWLAENGKAPIKYRKNYLTDIYTDLNRKDLQDMLPADVQQLMDFYSGKAEQRKFRFGLERKGGKGEIEENLWNILDVYHRAASHARNDSFIRRGSKYAEYLRREDVFLTKKGESFKKKYGVESSELIGYIEKQIAFDKRHPTQVDKFIGQFAKPVNRWLENIGMEGMQIKSTTDITHQATNLFYASQMGFRVKLPIRNFFQSTLPIARVGLKPWTQAMRSKDTPETMDALNKSDVWMARQASQLPVETGVQNNLATISLKGYKASDLYNVKKSFMSGYYAETGGKIAPTGSTLQKKAILKGNQVASETQWLYLRMNRSGVGQLFSPAAMFTTWSTNYLDFLMASAAPEHRMQLLQYASVSLGLMGVMAGLGIKGTQYTGVSSLGNIVDLIRGKLPLLGVTEQLGEGKLKMGAVRDFEKAIGGDVLDAVFYMDK